MVNTQNFNKPKTLNPILERTVKVSRVAKVIKGGRTLRFTAAVVDGNGNGELGIGNGKAANVDLAGFPHHALDNYLPKMVKAGHRVAICEQVEDPKLAKGIVKREVVEVVTPGTLTGDQTHNEKSNRYIGAICSLKQNSGIS